MTSSETGEMEMDISDDPYDVKRLDVSKAPVVVTLNKVRLTQDIVTVHVRFGKLINLSRLSLKSSI